MATQSLHELLVLFALGIALALVSRIWFARYLIRGLLAPAGRHFRIVYQLLRTPGNLIHETSHAMGLLIAGVRIADLRFWFNDPEGRGYVLAGPAYAPWGRPLLARLLAAPAPLLAGALALQAAARLLEVPYDTLMLHVGPHHWPGRAQLLHVWETIRSWLWTPTGALQAFLFGFLALSIGLELAPSKEDLKELAWPLFLVAIVLGLMEGAWRQWPASRTYLSKPDHYVAAGLAWLSGPLGWTLFVLIALGLLLTPLRWLVAGKSRMV